MKIILGFCLAVVTIALADVAWTITMTENIQALGGYFTWAFLTFCPITFFALGAITQFRDSPEDDFEHIVLTGDTHYRR